MAADTFTVEDAPKTEQPSFTIEDAPKSKQNPFAMLSEGQETEAQGNAAMAPTALPIAANIAGDLGGGPIAGGLAYAATKGMMSPEEVKAHPIRTAAETAGSMVLPGILGKASEYLKPAFSRLASGAGEMMDFLTTPSIKLGEEAAPGAAASANAVPTPPEPASMPAAGPPKPAPPLTNRQMGSRITQGVEEAAGVKPGQPIYPRPAQGTVGAKVPGEQPNIDIAGPRIQTPSRNETLTEAMKNRVPGSNPIERRVPMEEQPPSPARTPAQPAEETLHPMDRQFIHVNGSRLLEQIADKPELRDPLLDLEGNQLREVLRKSGEDMTQIQSVGKSAGKAMRGGRISDPNNLTRQEAFDRLLDKGYTPEQILKEAGERSKPAAARVPFGPPRTTTAKR